MRRASVGLALLALLLGLASIALAQSQEKRSIEESEHVEIAQLQQNVEEVAQSDGEEQGDDDSPDVTLQDLEELAEDEAEAEVSKSLDAKNVVLRRKSLSKKFKGELSEEAEQEAEDEIAKRIDQKKIVLRKKSFNRPYFTKIEKEVERETEAQRGIKQPRKRKPDPNALSPRQLADIKKEASILAMHELILQGVLKPEVDCDFNPCYEGCPLAGKEGICTPLDCFGSNHCRPGCPDSTNRKKCPHIKHNASTALSVSEVTYIVNRHNEVRRMLGLNLVEWDIKLAEGAQRFADTCAFKHSKKEDRETFYKLTNPTHSKHHSVGETLMADASIVAGPRIYFDAVIAQAENWDCERNNCRDERGREAQCGAFRQAFDQHTTKIGCGFKICQRDSPFGDVSTSWNNFVCWYNPMIRRDERPFPRSQCNLLDLDTLLPKGPAKEPEKFLTLFATGNKKVEKPPRRLNPEEEALELISQEYYQEFPQYKKLLKKFYPHKKF